MMATKTAARHKYPKKRKSDERKNKGLFAESHAVAPAPSRDYYALQVYQKHFLWTRWKISHGPYANPLQRMVSMEEFIKDLTMQNELSYIFGADTTTFIRELAHGNWSLTSMPSKVLHKIFTYLSVSDILRLSQVCKRLSKECSKNLLWEAICKKQWKILIHNDIEKANLIGWKRVYLEKMRPKRYRAATAHHANRHRVYSVSALNTPDSRASKSNFTIHKRVQELKKIDASRSSSEILGRDFKVTSTSTGKLTDRSYIVNKGRCSSRNSETRPSTGTTRSNPDRKHPFSSSVINLVPVIENPREHDAVRKNKSPRITKCKVTSIRTRSDTTPFVQPAKTLGAKLKAELPRPTTGRSLKAKQSLK